MYNKAIRLLSTGNLPEKDAFQTDACIDVIPFIRINETLTTDKRNQINEYAKERRTVIFTSQHAVSMVTSVLQTIPAWKIYCINGATQKAILNYWDKTSIIETAPDGATLATKIIQTHSETEILFYCGEQRLEQIPSILKEAGIPLKELHVYQTIAQYQEIKDRYDGILFYSPSAVHAFFAVNEPGEAHLFSIGLTTTAALEPYVNDQTKIITALYPSKTNMVKEAIDYIQKRDAYETKK